MYITYLCEERVGVDEGKLVGGLLTNNLTVGLFVRRADGLVVGLGVERMVG